jgi:predicted transcriptional regulator YheO
LLDKFQDILEVYRIIVFQTGHTSDQVADKIIMSRPHLSKLLNTIESGEVTPKVKAGLLNKLKWAYEKEITQFIQKYSTPAESNSVGLARDLTVVAEIQAALMEIVLAMVSEKKSVYNKSVEILKKHKLEGIFL